MFTSYLGIEKVLQPSWPAPARVKAFTTTRNTQIAGVAASQGNYASFNLGLNVGDNPAVVIARREALAAAIGKPLNWLNQTHSNLAISNLTANCEADASVTSSQDFACVVLTADCLPVFFCNPQGTQVGVAHAGWRGLAAGVLENTLAKFTCPKSEVLAWLGPAISQQAFEVGAEVKAAFLAASPKEVQTEIAAAFIPSTNAGKYMACLYSLATARLKAAGVQQVFIANPADLCTYTNNETYYSHRYATNELNQSTGRMASVIYLAD